MPAYQAYHHTILCVSDVSVTSVNTCGPWRVRSTGVLCIWGEKGHPHSNPGHHDDEKSAGTQLFWAWFEVCRNRKETTTFVCFPESWWGIGLVLMCFFLPRGWCDLSSAVISIVHGLKLWEGACLSKALLTRTNKYTKRLGRGMCAPYYQNSWHTSCRPISYHHFWGTLLF